MWASCHDSCLSDQQVAGVKGWIGSWKLTMMSRSSPCTLFSSASKRSTKLHPGSESAHGEEWSRGERSLVKSWMMGQWKAAKGVYPS